MSAQSTLSFEWVKQAGGLGPDSCHSVFLDSSGNVYAFGTFNDTVDFDPGPGVYNLEGPSTSVSYFLLKLDSLGAFLWARRLPRPGVVHVTPGGVTYVSGSFNGTIDFDPGSSIFNLTSTPAGFFNSNMYLLELDHNGHFTAARQFVNGSGFSGYTPGSITCDVGGSIYITGTFSGSNDFDPSAGTFNMTATTQNSFLLKLDPGMNFTWAKQFGNSNGSPASVKTDSYGNVYLSGKFSGTADFDPGPGTLNLSSGTATARNVFLLKVDPSGNIIWAKKMGGNQEAIPTSYDIDKSGTSYITGVFSGTADFDPGAGVYNLAASGPNNCFVVKIYSSGTFAWAEKIVLNGGMPNSLILDSGRNVLMTGSFIGTSDFDPGAGISPLVSHGQGDIFLTCYDSSLQLNWAKRWGGAGPDGSSSLAINPNGRLYTGGAFSQTVDFDPGIDSLKLSSSGGADLFVHAMKPCFFTSFHIDTTSTTCGMFQINGQIYTQSGFYTQHYQNAGGCDSTLTINVYIPSIDTTIIQYNNMLLCNAYGAIYQWVYCDSANTPVPGATSQYFIASQNGTYAVIITDTACTHTSNCYTITGVTGLEELNLGSWFSVYPNPASDIIHVQSRIPCSVSISTTQGVIVEQMRIEERAELDVRNLLPGLYLMIVRNEAGSPMRIERLIKY